MTVRYARVHHQGLPRWGRVFDERIEILDRDPVTDRQPPAVLYEIPMANAPILAPCEPTKILGVGTNYRAHALEMKKPLPDEPLLFMKPTTALIGPGAGIVRPRGFERTDYEGELGVVIGKRARRVREAEALDYVFGYTIVNDVTVRDLQKKDGQFTRAKGFDTFCPVGPWVVCGLDASNLRLRTRLNSETRQDSRTSDLIFSIARVIETVSRVMTLEPGDLITTGTPSGVGPIAPGDVVEIEIEGIGILRNPVVEESL
ncbi:MAG TPA: fumarylacetoacetate hydrolase family protein [Polyangia bacterium]|nr:fumarylacetoacetate hydrolase family protein [Polyangia bacterium]